MPTLQFCRSQPETTLHRMESVPVTLTDAGRKETCMETLPNPFLLRISECIRSSDRIWILCKTGVMKY